MDEQLVISSLIFGLSIGGILFLLSVGLSLVFGLMRVISLDQLLYYSLGAYMTYTILSTIGNFWVGLVVGMVVACLASLAVEKGVFKRIYEKEITFTMITSFGVLLAGVGAIKYIWGLVPRPVASPIAWKVMLGSTEVPVYRVFVIGVAFLVYVGIWLFLNKTIVGKAIRAGIEDAEKVEGLGINVYRLFTATFLIAGALSGLGGGLHAPLVMVDPHMGLEMIPFVFMVVIIGGLGSIKGTMISALIVGQVISLGSLVWAPLANMAPFATMMIILLIKPTGLYGSPMLRR